MFTMSQVRRFTAVRLAVVGLIIGCAILAGCSSSGSPNPSPSGELTIAVKPDQPGFSSGTTNLVGLDIDLAKWIAKSLNLTPVFTQINSAERDGVIPGNKANLVIATYSITGPRQNFEDFAGPYLKTTQAMLVRNDDRRFNPAKPYFAGMNVCTVSGSTPSQYKLPGNPTITAVDEYSQCVQGLLNDSFDAVFTDTLILYGYMQANPGRVRVAYAGVIGTNQYYGVALPLNDHSFCESIDTAIQQYVDQQWATDFRAQLPQAVNADPGNWDSDFGITPADISAQSCKS